MNKSTGGYYNMKDYDGFFRRNYQSLCYFAYRYLGSRTEAEDVVQGVFANILEGQSDWESETHFRRYIFKSVRNVCLNQIKYQETKTKLTEGSKPAKEYLARDFFAEIVRADIYDKIMQAVESLPDQRGIIFRMAFLDGRTNEEIAQELSLSINTVKSQKNKAKILLRERLKGLYPLAVLLLGL